MPQVNSQRLYKNYTMVERLRGHHHEEICQSLLKKSLNFNNLQDPDYKHNEAVKVEMSSPWQYLMSQGDITDMFYVVE